MFCGDLEGWDRGGGEEAPEGGGICVHRADPCTAETNTFEKQLYSNLKK